MGKEIFKEGDTVFHWDYGKGVIGGIQRGKVLGCTYRVIFEDIGTIWTREEHLSFTPYDLVNGGLSHERPHGLEVGKSYISKEHDLIALNWSGNDKNYGFSEGDWTTNLYCCDPEYWREATNQEVEEALKAEVIRRFGKNWEDTKLPRTGINSHINVNKNLFCPVIDVSAFVIWGRNGILFKDGEWAEPLKEPEFKPFDKVLVRDGIDSVWIIDFFSHMDLEKYVCLSSYWSQCIPYEGNEHLLDTPNPPKQ